MAQPRDGRSLLTVTIEVPPPLAADLDAVGAYFQEQMDQLQVPVSVVIETIAGERPALTVNGDRTTFTVSSDETLVGAAAFDAFNSRESAITPDVVSAVWSAWFNGEACPAPLAQSARRLLQNALRYGWRLDRVRPAAEKLRTRGSGGGEIALFEEAVADLVPRIGVRIGSEHTDELAGSVDKVPEMIFSELGLYIGRPSVTRDSTLAPLELQVHWNDVSLPRRTDKEEMAESVFVWLTAFMIRYGGALMSARLAEVYLLLLRRVLPHLADLLAERFDPFVLTRILRHLLDEQVSIRDFSTIADALLRVVVTSGGQGTVVFQTGTNIAYPAAAMANPPHLDAADYAEVARIGLQHSLSYKYPRDDLAVYLVDRELQRKIAAAKGALPEEERHAFVATAAAQLGDSQNPILLTGLTARRYIRKLLERELPGVAVLSLPNLRSGIQPRGTISL